MIRDVESRGLLARQEARFRTPGGEKQNRFADVVGLNRQTGEVEEIIQIGRTTKSGLPVARERRALNDILNSPDRPNGVDPRFIDVNQ